MISPKMTRKKITITSSTNHRVPISLVDAFSPDFSVFNAAGNDPIYIGSFTVDNTWIPLTASATDGIEKNYVHGTGTIDGCDPVLGFNLKEWYIYFTTLGESAIVEYFVRDRSH